MALTPKSQLEWKARVVGSVLGRRRGLESVSVEARPTAGIELEADGVCAYRNRAILPVQGRRLGYYRPRSHDVVDVSACGVLRPELQALLPAVRHAVAESRVAPYRENNRAGVLRRVALRTGTASGERMVTAVVARTGGVGALLRSLEEALPREVGISVNLQSSTGNAVFGSSTEAHRGPGWVTERVAGLEFRLAPTTFFQLHTAVAEQITERVVALAGNLDGAVVGDLYAGVGLFARRLLSAGASRAWVVETSPDSVAEARRWSHGEAVTVVTEDAAQALADIGPLDLAVTDPPRRGLGADGCAALLAAPPRRLIHVACSADALAKDLARLITGGYRMTGPVEVFDMLPETSHVEALAPLEWVGGREGEA